MLPGFHSRQRGKERIRICAVLVRAQWIIDNGNRIYDKGLPNRNRYNCNMIRIILQENIVVEHTSVSDMIGSKQLWFC